MTGLSAGRVGCGAVVLLVVLAPLLWLGALFATPVLAPILPRPSLVPRGADAHLDFKGSGGTAWEWCEATPSGRVQWGAFDAGRKVRLSLTLAQPCRGQTAAYGDPPDVTLWTSGDELLFFARNSSLFPMGAGAPCGFRVEAERMAGYRRVVAEARAQNRASEQAPHLAKLQRLLAAADGGALVTMADGSTCSNGLARR